MRNKKKLIIFLCLILLLNAVSPIKEAQAVGPIPVILGVAAVIGGAVGLLKGKDAIVKGLSAFFAFLIKWISWAFFTILWLINNHILAPLVDFISNLNPFGGEGASSPVAIIWNIFKNFAYILLVFSALIAGFEWLFGQDEAARRLIFHIIIVAFIINFTFVLVKEGYNLVDSLEKGLTGGESKKIGSIIAASMWQEDPFKTLEAIFSYVGKSEEESQAAVANNLALALSYLFVVGFEMLIFIILFITTGLFLARYIFVLFYAGVSSLAVATLAIPESRGTFAQLTKGLRQFENWLNGYIKWLLVIPVFAILVIIGNLIQQETFKQLSRLSGINDLIQFALVLFFMAAWYLLAIVAALRFSARVGEVSKFAAIGALGGMGMLAARGLIGLGGDRVGGFLERTGEWVQQKVGTGGIGGWRSWVHQTIGKGTADIGEKIKKKRWERDAQAVRSEFGRLEEQLRKETDPAKIQQFTSKINNLIDRYRNVPYIAEQLSENISKMNREAFAKIATDKNIVSYLGSPQMTSEMRNAFIEQIKKMRKATLEQIYQDPSLLQIYSSVSSDILTEFVEKTKDEFKDKDALSILANTQVRNFISGLAENHSLRQTINNLSLGLFEGLIKKDFEIISNALANFSREGLAKTQELDNIFRAYNLDPSPIYAKAIKKAPDPGLIIHTLMSKPKGDPIRQAISRLTDPEINEIERQLPPHLKDKFASIILEEIS